MRVVNVALGGPWYGSKVDARLAQSLVQFSAAATHFDVAVRDVIYEDGMLDLSRHRLLARAIAAGFDWLVSVDSDCSFMDQERAICAALRRQLLSEVAIVAAPVRQGTGDWNVTNFADQRLAAPPTESTTVGAIGFGWVAFRCGWYASHWPRQDRHFVPMFQTVILPAPGQKFGVGAWGEDFGHCKAVRDLGGKVVCDPSIRVRHHMVRPGHPAAKDE